MTVYIILTTVVCLIPTIFFLDYAVNAEIDNPKYLSSYGSMLGKPNILFSRVMAFIAFLMSLVGFVALSWVSYIFIRGIITSSFFEE